MSKQSDRKIKREILEERVKFFLNKQIPNNTSNFLKQNKFLCKSPDKNLVKGIRNYDHKGGNQQQRGHAHRVSERTRGVQERQDV